MSTTSEPILLENPQRFVIFPIKYEQFWQIYKKAVASFWVAEEINLQDDLEDYQNLTDNEKHFIEHVLAFFASADGIVNENLALRFYSEVQVPEIRCFYGFQIAMENIHGEVYSLLIDTLIKDPQRKSKLFKATANYPSIKLLTDWALKWLRSDAPFAHRLVAFACVEGILFSGPFCAIFWLKKRGLMPGLCQSNELISRDENLHMEFACLLHQHLQNKASPQDILTIIQEAYHFECQFITESLPCNLIGINAPHMRQYIEYVCDRLLTKLGCPKYWNSTNPFPWMDLISVSNKTNFF